MGGEFLTHEIRFTSGRHDFTFQVTEQKAKDIARLNMLPGDTLTLEIGRSRASFTADEWRAAVPTIRRISGPESPAV